MKARPSSHSLPTSTLRGTYTDDRKTNNQPLPESWLPDVYRYGKHNGLVSSPSSVQAPTHRRPQGMQPLPTAQQLNADRQKLFTPSAPRVDGKEEFNLDFGALALQLDETSYMAWF
jgi:hypothetical protein